MSAIRLKYFLFCLIVLGVHCLSAQESFDQSVVTIIGDDPIEANNTQDFVNTNPGRQLNNPPEDQKIINDNQNVITPSLENGFHMRFEVTYALPVERLGGTSFAPSSKGYNDDYEEAKKRTVTLTERTFNAKKKFRKWMPKRKKRYRPTLCGRF